jgi:NTP pyrophosphatase (non-canonical NTP hydrolase)
MNYAEYLREINELYVPYPQHRAENLAANAEAVECCLGLTGEVGEVVDMIKKSLMYNKPLDHKKLILELGDVFHYFIRLADQYYVSLPTLMEMNAEKLRARFPAGYSNAAAIAQADSTQPASE